MYSIAKYKGVEILYNIYVLSFTNILYSDILTTCITKFNIEIET